MSRPATPSSGVRYIPGVDLKDKPTKRTCSVADTLAIVGDRYSLLIVREIGYGYVRFEDLAGFTGAPRDVLTNRLRRLEEVERLPEADLRLWLAPPERRGCAVHGHPRLLVHTKRRVLHTCGT